MGAAGTAPRPSVALVLPSFGSGGAERVVLNLATGLRARGSSVRLLVLDGRGPLRDRVPAGVAIVDLDRPRARRAGPALVAELRRRPVDLLVGSQTHVNVLLGLLRPLLPHSTRLVLREPSLLPGADTRSARDRALGRALGRADLLVASSPVMHEHLVAIVRGRTRVHLLPNPVDVESLRAMVTRDGSLRPEHRTTHLVSVGRLVALKAHDDLLHALARSGTDSTLTIVGDGPERDRLERLTGALGLTGRVELTGRIDDPARLARTVASADLLVHPSRTEGLPNAILEALALGTPVLATTDLTVLASLADELGPAALRLVPRETLSDALAGSGGSASPAADGPPRPSLLPARFSLTKVVDALLDAVNVVGSRSGA